MVSNQALWKMPHFTITVHSPSFVLLGLWPMSLSIETHCVIPLPNIDFHTLIGKPLPLCVLAIVSTRGSHMLADIIQRLVCK